MKKIELLAPAGNMEALHAGVMAGCDAVYLAGNNFGARAFAKNFSNDEIIEAIRYCHLYGVKVYVTVNTVIFENEVNDFMEYIEFLHKNNVDAVIMQDFGMFDLVRRTFPNLEIHASTQMHIHNLDGTQLMERLGMKRVVLARETSIDDIKYIKENSNVELEVFVHGALCISYSGQCLMSSLIGGRSGNRGACAGSCRLKYDVIDEYGNKLNKGDYPLSTKDLNSLENVGKLIDAGVSSLKIEGRMKSPEYVYMVVSLYRKAIDSYYDKGIVTIDDNELLKLKKIFNRDFTKGFLFNTDNNDLINGYRPNHMGVPVGKVIDYMRGIAIIKLSGDISIGSGLRVIGKKNDVGIVVNDFYIGSKLVKKAKSGDTISIKVNSDVTVGDTVVITVDKEVNNEIAEIINSNFRKVIISGKFYGRIGEKATLAISDGVNEVRVYGNLVEKALKKPMNEEIILEKLNKLGDTVYDFSKFTMDIGDNIFIPVKELNRLRRDAINKLDKMRLYEIPFEKRDYMMDINNLNLPNFERKRITCCLVDNKDKYNNLDRDYDVVYCEEIAGGTIKKLPRVIKEYKKNDDLVLVGEIGAFNKLSNVDTDFSLNVVNSYTVAFLHSLGAKKICLSYELNDSQIKNIIDNYKKRYGKRPNLELIVNGNEEVMISKFSLNKYYNNDKIYLRDMFGNRYKVITKNDLMYIYNYKKRDNYSARYYDMGVNSLRFNLDI